MSKVEILCPNGHRVSVNVSSNTKIIKILEEACVKQGFLPINFYELKHGRKSLELSSTFDKSGLINNSKVELLRLKEEWKEDRVEVNIQSSDGTRIKNEFTSQISLFEVLKSFEMDVKVGGGVKLTQHESLHPVLIHVNEQLVGEYQLLHTTLKSLGIIKGRVLFRHVFREVEENTLVEIKESLMKEKVRMDRWIAKAEEKKKENEERGVIDGARGGMDVVSVDKRIERGEEKMDVIEEERQNEEDRPLKQQQYEKPKKPMQQNPSSQNQQNNLPSTSNQHHSQHPKHIQQHSQPQQHLQPQQQPQQHSQPQQYSQPQQHSQPQQLHQKLQPQQQPPLTQTIQDLPFISFKFPEATKGKELYRNELSDYRKEEFQSCHREVIVYKIDESMEVDLQEEIPESFYDVTQADAALMQKRLQRKCKEFSDQPLSTDWMREQTNEDVISRYARVIVRFQTANAEVVQALFMIRETVNALYKFVKEILVDEEFELYTSPPKNVLSDLTQTLIEAQLVPMSRVYISNPSHTACTLKTHVVQAYKSTLLHADQVVFKWLSLKEENNKEDTATKEETKDADLKRKNKEDDTKTGKKNEHTALPKWLKKGKK